MGELQVGGTLKEGDFYVKRPEDDLVHDLLSRGEYCNILTSRQMGKSSLMWKVSQRLQTAGVRTASVDMAGELGTPTAADEWYSGLLYKICLDLDVDVDAYAWWRAAAGPPNVRLMKFFLTHVASSAEPTVVFLDEIDATLKLQFSDDLFTALRSMYNARSEQPAYGRVTFCLVGTATPDELIQDPRTTPYNVGRTVQLGDFDRERDAGQLARLETLLDSKGLPGSRLLDSVFAWTGGQPFLTVAFCHLAIDKRLHAISPIVDEALADQKASPFRIHFEWMEKFMKSRVEDVHKTLALYRKVLAGRKVRDRGTQEHGRLKLAGFVKRDARGLLVVRNQLYGKRFGPDWVKQVTPPLSPRDRAIAIAVSVIAGAVGLAVAVNWISLEYFRREQERIAAEQAAKQKQIDELVAQLTKATSESDALELRRKIEQLDTRAADVAIGAFWRQRAEQLEYRAEVWTRAGCVDEAALLYALAGVKRGVLPELAKDRLRSSGFRRFERTYRTTTSGIGIQEEQCASAPSAACSRLLTLGDREVLAACGETIHLWSDRGHSSKHVVGMQDLAVAGRWAVALAAQGGGPPSANVIRVIELDALRAAAADTERPAIEMPIDACPSPTAMAATAAGAGVRIAVGCGKSGEVVVWDVEDLGGTKALRDRDASRLRTTPLGREIPAVDAVRFVGADRIAAATQFGAEGWQRASSRRWRSVATTRAAQVLDVGIGPTGAELLLGGPQQASLWEITAKDASPIPILSEPGLFIGHVASNQASGAVLLGGSQGKTRGFALYLDRGGRREISFDERLVDDVRFAGERPLVSVGGNVRSWSPSPGEDAWDAEEVWLEIQTALGLTVNASETVVVPLGPNERARTSEGNRHGKTR